MKMTQDNFEGLTITLKKRKLNLNRNTYKSVDTIPDSDYLVLGHYDQLTIKYVTNWWEWTPGQTEAISLEDAFIDKYSIKAYFPENKRRTEYQKKGYDYTIWNNHEDDFPFVIVSVINISEEYARKILNCGANVCDAFSQVILDCVKEKSLEEKWPQMHCALLPTIGFSDFLLLFKTSDLKSTLNLLEQLKETLIGNAPCLSNAYTMIGFRNNGLDGLQDEHVGGIKLAIRFSLKDGVSARQLHTYLKKEFNNIQTRKNKADIESRYQVLGDADFLIVPNMNLQQLLPLYFYQNQPGLFHPAHDLFKNYIRSIQSEVRGDAMRDEANISHITEIREEKDVHNITVEYTKIIFQLEQFMNDHRFPERIVYGLQIVMKRFLQLIQSGHCFDMEHIIGGAFRNLIICLEQSMIIADKKKKEDPDTAIDEIDEMCSALNMFRDRIGDYLADMQRSDSLFLEGRSLSHPSIGSATKLLFFYNGCIDLVINILCSDEEKGRYQFVVTSGGTDETGATDLFSYLNPARENASSIIIMTVPEASLYDVKSSLFHVLHEMLHFCGERERKGRLAFIIDAVCRYTAESFGDFMEKEQQELYLETLKPLKPYITRDVINKIIKAIELQTTALKTKIAEQLKDRIMTEIPTNLDYKHYFGREIYKSIYTIIEEKIFVSNEIFNLEFYNIFLNYRYILAKEIENILRKNHIPYSNVNIFCSKLEKIKKCIENNDTTDYVADDQKVIKAIINMYLDKDIPKNELSIKIAEEDESFSLDQILVCLKFLFEECYADCMAGKILDLHLEHFIFSFLAEKRNERSAFPSDVESKLRMIIDLKYLFKIEDAFPDNIKQKLIIYAEKMQETGMKHIEIDSLISRLEDLISTKGEKDKIEALIEPVISYLEQCEKKWNAQKLFEKFKEIQKINQYSEMETSENIYGFLQSVADKWIGYVRR